MKLKQRVIVTGSLFLTMVTLFMIGIHLSWPGTDLQKEQPRNIVGASKRVPLPPPTALPSPRRSDLRSRMERERNPIPKVPNFAEMARKMLGNRSFHSPLSNMSDPLLESLQQRMNQSLSMRGPPPLRTKLDSMGNPPSSDFNVLPEFLRERVKNLHREGTPPPSSIAIATTVVSHDIVIPKEVAKRDPWEIWESWVEQNYLYPEDAFWSDEMNHILKTMATAPITQFGVGHKGTQLKATLMLDKQRTAFKPQRYERDKVLTGEPYVGYDRHNGEIAGFHLDGILGLRIAPPVVGRRINLTAIKPVTTEKLLSTYVMKNGNTCFYGKCYYCKPDDLACAKGDIMEGSVTLWLPKWYELKTRRHPYQRTYRDGVKAKWETNNLYCKQLLKESSEYYHGILDITESAVYDFLMGNADRHHYETYFRAKKHGRIMHIDNGKTFGNPHHDELSILAPVSQCCRLRTSTWEKLKFFNSSRDESLSEVLDRSLRRDSLWPILTQDHLRAIDRRLKTIMEVIDGCLKKHGKDIVIVDKWS